MIRLLRWNLEYAKDIEFYRDLQGRGLASPLDELEPTRDQLVIWFLDVFRTLEASRQPQGSIPISEILIFSDYFDLMCPLDQFLRTIIRMDETLLAHMAKQRQKDERKRKSTNRTR